MIINFLVFVAFVFSIISILYCLGLVWLKMMGNKHDKTDLKEWWLICLHGGLLTVILSYIFMIVMMGCYFGGNIINNLEYLI